MAKKADGKSDPVFDRGSLCAESLLFHQRGHLDRYAGRQACAPSPPSWLCPVCCVGSLCSLYKYISSIYSSSSSSLEKTSLLARYALLIVVRSSSSFSSIYSPLSWCFQGRFSPHLYLAFFRALSTPLIMTGWCSLVEWPQSFHAAAAAAATSSIVLYVPGIIYFTRYLTGGVIFQRKLDDITAQSRGK